MAKSKALVKVGKIKKSILLVRGEKVIIDADLAEAYGVTTKALNQAIRRNADRFPSDFMFRLTKNEKQEVVTNCDHLNNLKFSPVTPNAFTEHGAIMAASVLNSPKAIEVSVLSSALSFNSARQSQGTRNWPAKLENSRENLVTTMNK
jgi:hypothetical protein